MRRNGINYDTGVKAIGNRLSRASFKPAQVRKEMAVIARDLHCTAVRISGGAARVVTCAPRSRLCFLWRDEGARQRNGSGVSQHALRTNGIVLRARGAEQETWPTVIWH
jgi:hypothetical protein